jgi:hypothetical protein
MQVKVKNPEDQLEFQQQVAAEPDLYTMLFEAHDPKVKIENEIFPRQHEVYNCTTCKNGKPEHPAHKIKDPENFRVRCKWNQQWNTGPRWNDIGCPAWDRKLERPRHGLMPGVESGPYDPSERR